MHLSVHLDLDDGASSTAPASRRLAVDAPDVTIAEAVAACVDGSRLATERWSASIDGRAVERGSTLADAGARHGSRLVVRAHGRTALPPPAAVWLETAGLDAGARHPLRAGVLRVGRDASAADVVLTAPTISRDHAELAVGVGRATITDRASTNGIRRRGCATAAPLALGPGDRVQLGAAELLLAAPEVDRPPAPRPADGGAAGTTPFNRPPRVADLDAPGPIEVPPPPAPTPPVSSPSWALVGIPLIVGLGMAWLVNPLFAAFALVSPLVAVGSWVEQRRRAARRRRRTAEAQRTCLDAFAARLATARVDEVARRHRAQPDLATLHARARHGDTTLWERRLDHDDALRLRVGIASLPWMPALDRTARERDPTAEGRLTDVAVLPDVPVVVAAAPGAVVGVVGSPAVRRRVARALVLQATVLHGPADLRIAVATDDGSAASWSFVTWLPHADRWGAHGRGVAVGSEDRAHLAARPAPTADPSVALLVVEGTTVTRHDRLHALLPSTATPDRSVIVLADAREQLPAACSTIVACIDDDGTAIVTTPATGGRVEDVLVDGASLATADQIARALAGWHDPEVRSRGTDDGPLRLDELVAGWEAMHGLAADDARPGADLAGTLADRWARTGGLGPVPLLLGADDGDEPGVLGVDLVTDGPHVLVGGTTGSGKSELLRTMIASLASIVGPEHVNFVLIDYKGGSAFDACAALPHTVGLVTDLDDELAARALRSLHAELRHREARLRAAGAADLAAYERWRTALDPVARPPALARLLVIIDEFATLATDAPGFLDALVSVAQRGRSLGVHLVLATQRPHGAINDRIRTNTNARVALRVLDPIESADVIGSADAAGIGRDEPGRGFVRLGHDDLRGFRSVLVSAPARDAPDQKPPRVRVLDELGRGTEPDVPRERARAGPSQLDELVAAAIEAHRASDRPAPRRPWLPPLPMRVDPFDLTRPATDEGEGVTDELLDLPVGLVDEPDRQEQRTWWWRPRAGTLLLHGMPGTGATSALRTLAVTAAGRADAASLHLYAIAKAPAPFDHLLSLPHAGAVVGVDEPVRLHRLIHDLHDLLTRRRSGTAQGPAVLVLLDGLAALRSATDDLAGLALLEHLTRLAVEGPAVGLHLAIAVERPHAVPPAIAAATTQRLALPLADAHDYHLCGIEPPPRGALPPPGRARTADGREVQLAVLDDEQLTSTCRAIASTARLRGPLDAARRPMPVRELPARVDDLALDASIEPRRWRLPVGLADTDLQPCSLELLPGDHLLVTGPAGSGRTTTLQLFDRAASAVGACTSWFTASDASPDELLAARDQALARNRPFLALIDDADRVGDPDGALAALVDDDRPSVRVIAAARHDRVRGAYGHWTRRLRASPVGLALRPDLELDGDLWGVRFPRGIVTTWPPGRALLVRDGTAVLVQVAR